MPYPTVHCCSLRTCHINSPIFDGQLCASNSKIVQPMQHSQTPHYPHDDRSVGSAWSPMADTSNRCLSAMVDDHRNRTWCGNLYLPMRQICHDRHQKLTFECMRGRTNVWFFVLWDNSRPMVQLVNNGRNNHLNCVDICFEWKIRWNWYSWNVVALFTHNFGSRLRLIVPSILANWISTSSSPDELVGLMDDAVGGRENGEGVDFTSDELCNYAVLVRTTNITRILFYFTHTVDAEDTETVFM